MGLPAAVDLNTPLPAAVTGRDQGWITRYRRYPVFGPAWARGRARTIGVVVSAAAVLLLGSALLAAPDDKPIGAALQALLGVLVPLFAGPALGAWLRRRGWAPHLEWRALVLAMAGIVLAMAAFHEWGAEPLKQAMAEATGMVDAQGQRRRVALMIGVTVQSPDGAASSAMPAALGRVPPSASRPAAAAAPASSAGPTASAAPRAATVDGDDGLPRRTSWPGRLLTALATFALAGGFALPRWRRERDELAALAHERELAAAEAARHEAEMRLSVLAAQVEPHFLFNTLAGVRSAIATDPARAAEMVDRLSDYLRAAIPRLRSDGRAQSTLGDQLDIVRAYLGLMSARMPRLRATLEVPEALRARPFPPLMLISLAENAVKHGIEPKIGPGHVSIDARTLDDGRLQVVVADDGVGFDHVASRSGGGGGGSGIGLANIRERLAQMFGARGELELRSRPEGGVAATLTLPADPLPP